MAECKYLTECHFFTDTSIMKDFGDTRQMLIETFCHRDGTGCAIYRAITLLGKENVPRTLCPNQEYRLEELIQGKNPPGG